MIDADSSLDTARIAEGPQSHKGVISQAQSDTSTDASVTNVAPPGVALSHKCCMAVRVRTAAGSLVLSLGLEESADITVTQLKSKVLDVVGRENQIKLIVGTKELEDCEILDEVDVAGEFLEVLLVTSQVPQLDPDTPVEEQKEILKGMITSFSPDYQLVGAKHIRKLLSSEVHPPIQEFIDLGIVSRLLALGAGKDGATPAVQLEALWGLTNIASGSSEQTQAVVEEGALPVLVGLLNEESHDDLFEQVAWVIGNIAGDSCFLRDRAQEAGAMPKLLEKLQAWSPDDSLMWNMSLMRTATWAVSNLCRGKPPPRLEHVAPSIPVLARLLEHSDDEVLTDAAWSISYISEGPNERIAAVVQEAGLCLRLVALLSHPSEAVRTPVLRALGNLATGDEHLTQAVLDAGALGSLRELLGDARASVRRDTCWMLSIILAGSTHQIQSVMDAGLVPPLLERLSEDRHEVMKEAAWSFMNASAGGTPGQMQQLVDDGCIEGMASLFQSHDVRLVNVALDFFEKVLAVPEPSALPDASGGRSHADRVRDTVSIDGLQALADNDDENVACKAATMLERLYMHGVDERPSA